MAKSRKPIRVGIKALRFSSLLFSIVFVPSLLILLLVMYPGVIWHDDVVALIMFVGGGHTEHISLLWQLIAYPLLYLSGNVLVYAVFQQLVIALAATFAITKLLKLKIIKTKRTAIILAVFYALCPTYLWFNQMLSVDVIFSALLLPVTALLIETTLTKGKNLTTKTNVVVFTLLLFFIFEFRKNAVLIIPIVAVALFIVCKEHRRQVATLFGLVIMSIVLFSGITHRVFGNVIADPNGEMLAVPFQQIGKVYAQHRYIPPDIKNVLDTVHPAEYWEKSYDPQIADPLKNGIEVTPSFIKNWIKLGLKYPGTYIQAYLALEYPFFTFGPNDVSGNYAVALTVSKQPELRQAYATMCQTDGCSTSFKDQILTPGNEKQLYFARLPSEIANNNIPIVSDLFKDLFFNTGLPFYIMLTAIVVSLARRRYELLITTAPLWGIMAVFLLTAPVGQFRYSIQAYCILPVIVILLWRERPYLRERA